MSLDEFRAAIAAPLDAIDRTLGRQGKPPALRPMHAAVELVRFCVDRVSTDGGDGEPPGEFRDYAASKWFRGVYQEVDRWYRNRYGAAIDAPREKRLTGVVSLIDTPFLMRVPTTTIEPGDPGESFWLCYHDCVRDYENPLDWVDQLPNLAALTPQDVRKAAAEANQTASRLRAINILTMETGSLDAQARDLRAGVIPHLERAAEGLAAGRAETMGPAHWDMQMACELALKALTQERAGSYTETHDLFVLYDRVPGEAAAVSRSELKKLRPWQEMAELRYVGAEAISIADALRTYRATLRIAEAAMAGMKRPYRIGSAKFHLQRPPWLGEG